MKFDLCIKALAFLLIISTFNEAWGQDYTPESLLVTLFTDGKALIEYRLSTDVTVPTITVPLFGTTFEQVIVIDDRNQPVDNQIEGNDLVVDTFGASDILITYTAPDLVSKTGRLWTFAIDSPIDVSIKLPGDSTIIGMNPIPKFITPNQEEYLVVMPSGHTEVSYVIGALGTKEHANAAISGAEKRISDLKANGIVVSAAEAKLEEAKNAFEGSKYSDAEKLANDAKTLANTASQNAKLVTSAINDAEASIEDATNEGIPVTEAQQLLSKAKEEYGKGNYQEALAFAEGAKTAAVDAINSPPDNQNQIYLLGGGIAAAAGGAGVAMYVHSRKKTSV